MPKVFILFITAMVGLATLTYFFHYGFPSLGIHWTLVISGINMIMLISIFQRQAYVADKLSNNQKKIAAKIDELSKRIK